jgi:septal ring factor EnvC (AmiA/AmiB activator)
MILQIYLKKKNENKINNNDNKNEIEHSIEFEVVNEEEKPKSKKQLKKEKKNQKKKMERMTEEIISLHDTLYKKQINDKKCEAVPEEEQRKLINKIAELYIAENFEEMIKLTKQLKQEYLNKKVLENFMSEVIARHILEKLG